MRPDAQPAAAIGPGDAAAKLIVDKMASVLGQSIVVEHVPGAGGTIGSRLVVDAPADGYTILMGTIAALSINPTLYGNLPFDPLKDLLPVTRATRFLPDLPRRRSSWPR